MAEQQFSKTKRKTARNTKHFEDSSVTDSGDDSVIDSDDDSVIDSGDNSSRETSELDSGDDDDWLLAENNNEERFNTNYENVEDNTSDNLDDTPLSHRWDNFMRDLTWSESGTFTPTIHEFKDQHIGVQNGVKC